MTKINKLLLASAIIFASTNVYAEDKVEGKKVVTLIIKNHKFLPDQIKIPAGKPVTLNIKNQDATPEEFESPKLKLEKIIAGSSEVNLNIRPQKAGIYKFEGEFNPATAQGVIVAE